MFGHKIENCFVEKFVMVLSGSRRFLYTLKVKNEQEAKQMQKKIRTHSHAILLSLTAVVESWY